MKTQYILKIPTFWVLQCCLMLFLALPSFAQTVDIIDSPDATAISPGFDASSSGLFGNPQDKTLIGFANRAYGFYVDNASTSGRLLSYDGTSFTEVTISDPSNPTVTYEFLNAAGLLVVNGDLYAIVRPISGSVISLSRINSSNPNTATVISSPIPGSFGIGGSLSNIAVYNDEKIILPFSNGTSTSIGHFDTNTSSFTVAPLLTIYNTASRGYEANVEGFFVGSKYIVMYDRTGAAIRDVGIYDVTNGNLQTIQTPTSISTGANSFRGYTGNGASDGNNLYLVYKDDGFGSFLVKYALSDPAITTSLQVLNNPTGFQAIGQPYVIGNSIYVSSINDAAGSENLLKYNGTGTNLIALGHPTVGTYNMNSSGHKVNETIIYNNELYFLYRQDGGPEFLAKYDGTSANVEKVPTTGALATADFLGWRIVYDNNLYLKYDGNRLVRWNGTSLDEITFPTGYSYRGFPQVFNVNGNDLLFLKGNKGTNLVVMSYDGTNPPVPYDNPTTHNGNGDGYQNDALFYNSTVYFRSRQSNNNYDLSKIAFTSINLNAPTQLTYCPSDNISLSFTTVGTFGTPNTFTAELVDAGGTVQASATPTITGTNGTATIAIPASAAVAADYKVRITSTNPALSSNEITVGVGAQANNNPAGAVVLSNVTSVAFDITTITPPTGGADGYVILVNDANTFTAPTNGSLPTADDTWNGSGQQVVYAGTSASPNVTISNLDANTTYYYRIYAYKDCAGTIGFENSGSGGIITTLSINISVNTLAQSNYCQGATISVPFTTTSSFNTGNTFTVELSDASGSFAAPTNIGSGTASPVSATIPTGAANGTGYQVRVVSSNPSFTSAASAAFSVGAVAPNAVTSNIVGTNTPNSVDVPSFTAPTGGTDGYVILFNQGNTFTTPSGALTVDTNWQNSGQQVVYEGTSDAPNVTVYGVSPLTQYYYKVYPYNECAGNRVYNTTSTSTPLATPGDGFTLNPLSSSTLCIGGDLDIEVVATGFVGSPTFDYEVQLSDASGVFGGSPTVIGTSSTTQTIETISVTIPGTTTAGTNYRIRLIENTVTSGTVSNFSTVTIQSCAGGGGGSGGGGNNSTPLPTSPTAFEANVTSPSEVNLSWSAGQNADAYLVYQNGTLIATLPSNANSFEITGLDENTRYRFSIQARNSRGTSSQVNATVVTFAEAPSILELGFVCDEGGAEVALQSSGSVYNVYADSTSQNSLLTSNNARFSLPSISTNTTFFVSVLNLEGVESSRTSLSIEVKSSPEAAINGESTQYSCDDELGLVAIPSQGNVQYEWLFGNNVVGTGDNFTATRSGRYQLRVTRDGCSTVSEPVNVRLNFSPIAQIAEGSSLSLCADGTLTASNVVEGAEYRWIESENIIAIGISPQTRGTGTCILEVEQNGCVARAEIQVTVTNLPTNTRISASETTFCPGSEVTLAVENPTQELTYTWVRNGRALRNETNLTLTTSVPGTYSVEVSQNGCTTGSEMVSIERIQVPRVFLRKTETTLFVEPETEEEITNIVWFKGGEQAPEFEGQTTITPSESDYYRADVTYITGCVESSRTEYFRVEEIVLGEDDEEESPSFFNIYPNPSTDGVFNIELVESVGSTTQIEVSDILGRTIKSVKLPRATKSYRLELNNAAKGTYMIRLTQEGQIQTLKVVVE